MATKAELTTRLAGLNAEYDRLLNLGMEEYSLDGKKTSVQGRMEFISKEIKSYEGRLARISRRGTRYHKTHFGSP